MSQRTDYLIQILDKIGGPLMNAVVAAPHSQDDTSTQSDAQAIASLLGKVVEVSIAMNDALDLKPEDAQNDSLRVALAALAGPLVAGQYAQNFQIPKENDLKRIQAAMQAVLTFGDNFTPSPEHIERLRKLQNDQGGGSAPIDAHQVNIQYVHAFIPVVNAVGTFSFGQPEQKLIMDIADRLVKNSIEMRESLLPELDGDDQKLAELGLLRALTQIYAACHSAETQRLSAMKDQEAPDASSMANVWKGFETRAAMLEALVRNILPGTAQRAAAPASSIVPEQGKPYEAQELPVPVQETPPPVVAPEAPPAAPPPPPASPAVPPASAPASPPAQSGGGPMSFFKKPGSEESSAPASPPPPPPAAEPPPAAPPAPPPAPPPAEKKEEDKGDSQSGSGSQSGGNPMSFFKKSE